MFQILQILTTVLVAVAMAPALAHALEYPGKMRLSRDAYLTVQAIYYPGLRLREDRRGRRIVFWIYPTASEQVLARERGDRQSWLASLPLTQRNDREGKMMPGLKTFARPLGVLAYRPRRMIFISFLFFFLRWRTSNRGSIVGTIEPVR